MWLKTEQGAINLAFCCSLIVHPEGPEGGPAEAYAVCARMNDESHIHVDARQDYEGARAVCDQIVALLTENCDIIGATV